MVFRIERRPSASLLAVLLLALTAAACSSKPGPEDKPVQELTCERGVLAADKKSCINAVNCNQDDTQCLEGLVCRDTQCVVKECGGELGDCDRGRCNEKGLCVSKDTCQAGDLDNSCISGEVCIEQRCRELKFCSDVGTCAVADPACKRMKELCIEKDTCANSDECRSTSYCNPNTSACESNLCIVNGVERDCSAENGGVCDKKTGQCVDVEKCKNASECIDNADLTQKRICHFNPAEASPQDRQCLIYSEVCDATCRLHERCQYDTNSMEMSCGDGSCSTILDCKKSEYCDGTQCQKISDYQCTPDATNNDRANATDFNTKQTDGLLEHLSLCKNDIDVYVIDDIPSYTAKGELIVIELDYDGPSKGRQVDTKMTVTLIKKDPTTGDESELETPLTLTSFRKDGAEPAETYKDNILYYVNAGSKADLAKIYVEVEHNSPDNSLGIDYSLEVRSTTQDYFEMCQLSESLKFEADAGKLKSELRFQNLGSAQTHAASFPSEAACADGSGTIPELAYNFKVEGTSEKLVTISASPAVGSDLNPTLILFGKCEQAEFVANQIGESGCQEKGDVNVPEQYKVLLQPGEYTIVVTAKDDASIGNGQFDLLVTQEDPACNPVTENECDPDNKKIVCDPFREKLLPGEDCTLTGGRCFDYGEGRVGCVEDFGATCNTPHIVAKDKDIINLVRDLKNMPGQSPNSSFTCDGKIEERKVKEGEVYVMAEVPDGYTAIITATPDSSNKKHTQFTIYSMKGCGATQCEAISHEDYFLDEKRTLSYKNTSGSDENIYFVIESAEEYTGKVRIDAKVVETSTLACSPGITSCDTSDSSNHKLVTCEDDGTGTYAEVSTSCGGKTCSASGTSAACELGGDTCGDAIEPVIGKFYDIDDAKLTDHYGSPANCLGTFDDPGISDTAETNHDAVFKVDAAPGNYIRITVEGPSELMIWEMDGCPAPTSNFCRYGTNSGITHYAQKLIVPATTGPQYFVAEKMFDGGRAATGPLRVKFEVIPDSCHKSLAEPTCNQTTNEVTFCNKYDIEETVVCESGCIPGPPARCTSVKNLDKGSSCANAILLTDGGKKSDITQGRFYLDPSAYWPSEGTDEFALRSGLNGECSLEASSTSSQTTASYGLDRIYAVQLQGDEVLKYRLKGSLYDPVPNRSLQAYVVDKSCTPQGCLQMRDRNFVVEHGGASYEETPGVDYYHTYYPKDPSTSEIVYLVVELAENEYPNLQYLLEWKIESNTTGTRHNPYDITCVGTDVGYFDLQGIWQTTPCGADTECRNGACQPTTLLPSGKLKGDVCDESQLNKYTAPAAFVIESGGANSIMQLTNDANPKCRHRNLQADGDDFFFKVDVPPQKTLVVRGLSAGIGAPTVYISQSCTDIKGSNPTCLAGAQGGTRYGVESDHAVAEYYNSDPTSSVEVVVGLDSARNLSSDKLNDVFYYTIDFVDSNNCTNRNEVACKTVGSTSKLVTCRLGGDVDVPNGACPAGCHPSGKECLLTGESPDQAITLTKSATPQTVTNTNLSSSHDTSKRLVKTYNGVNSLVYGSCPFHSKPVGPDQWYKINLKHGEFLTATLKSLSTYSGPDYQKGFQFYLVDGNKNTCISLAQSATPEETLNVDPLTIQFQNFNPTRDFYLVVDNLNETVAAGDSSAFEIEYKVEAKVSDCQEGMSQCQGDSHIFVCETPGQGAVNRKCVYGCVGRACRASRAVYNSHLTTNTYDMCEKPNEPSTPLPTVIIYDTESSDFNLDHKTNSMNCGSMKENSRNDIFVKVLLNNKEYVKVQDIRSIGAFRPGYYVTKKDSCLDGSFVCEDGQVSPEETTGGTTPEPSTTRRETNLPYGASSGMQEFYVGITPVETSTYANAALIFLSKAKIACNVNAPKSCGGSPDGVTYCASPTTPALTYDCPATANACYASKPFCQPANVKPGDSPFAPHDLDAVLQPDASTNGKKGTFTGSTIGYTNSYGSDGKSACFEEIPSYTQPAADAFHAITIPNGQTLDITLKATSGDPTVYLYRFQDRLLQPQRNSAPYPFCYAGRDGGGTTETITYTNNTGQDDVFIFVADGFTEDQEYDYELTFTVAP